MPNIIAYYWQYANGVAVQIMAIPVLFAMFFAIATFVYNQTQHK